MPAAHAVYRACVGLYPSAFRREYGDDLVRCFAGDDDAEGRGAEHDRRDQQHGAGG